MAIKRGTGRQALIDATVEVLRRGDEVQVKEVAAAVGVSHTLIYRHFPTGGKDELVAEAYAEIFRGLAHEDQAMLFALLDRGSLSRDECRRFFASILHPNRDGMRWSRLEVLSHSRTNPFVAQRIDAAREELVRTFAERLRIVNPHLTATKALAISMIAQAVPLGLAAITGDGLSKRQRLELIDVWTDAFMGMIEIDSSANGGGSSIP